MRDFTVIFDMDGVILDSERVYQNIERQMYAELGIPVSKKEHLEFMGTAERFMWTELKKRHGINKDVDFLIREERRRFMSYLEIPGTIPLMEGLLPLLESLQKAEIPIWVASSSSREIIEKVLSLNHLLLFYDGFIGGDEVVQSKPSPEIFLKTARMANTPPSHCLVIEDSINGILAARAAEMTVVALRNPGNDVLDFTGSDLIVNRLDELNADILLKTSASHRN